MLPFTGQQSNFTSRPITPTYMFNLSVRCILVKIGSVKTRTNLECRSKRLQGNFWDLRYKAWCGRAWSPVRGRYRRAYRSSVDGRGQWRRPCNRWTQSLSWRSDRATSDRRALTSPVSRDRKYIRLWRPRCGSTGQSHQAALHAMQYDMMRYDGGNLIDVKSKADSSAQTKSNSTL